jgi:hypothetical protein
MNPVKNFVEPPITDRNATISQVFDAMRKAGWKKEVIATHQRFGLPAVGMMKIGSERLHYTLPKS